MLLILTVLSKATVGRSCRCSSPREMNHGVLGVPWLQLIPPSLSNAMNKEQTFHSWLCVSFLHCLRACTGLPLAPSQHTLVQPSFPRA